MGKFNYGHNGGSRLSHRKSDRKLTESTATWKRIEINYSNYVATYFSTRGLLSVLDLFNYVCSVKYILKVLIDCKIHVIIYVDLFIYFGMLYL